MRRGQEAIERSGLLSPHAVHRRQTKPPTGHKYLSIKQQSGDSQTSRPVADESPTCMQCNAVRSPNLSLPEIVSGPSHAPRSSWTSPASSSSCPSSPRASPQQPRWPSLSSPCCDVRGVLFVLSKIRWRVCTSYINEVTCDLSLVACSEQKVCCGEGETDEQHAHACVGEI